MTVDVAIVGAGVAGSVLAATAARLGLKVAMIEAGRAREHPIGETLPGAALRLLCDAGFVPSAVHAPLGGTLSCWGHSAPFAQDHFAHPHGPGLRLDRGAFEAELRDWAWVSGAELHHAKVRKVENISGGTQVSLSSGAEFEARYLVDASGRGASLARRLGARRTIGRPLFAVYGIVQGAAAGHCRTMIESAADGWRYAVELPDGRTLAAIHCDIELAHSVRDDRIGAAGSGPALDRASFAEAGMRGLETFHRRRGTSASAEAEELLAIGDAAPTRPADMHGLFAAIEDGFGARPRWRPALPAIMQFSLIFW